MHFKVPGEYLQGHSKIALAVETTFSAVSPSPNLINDHTLDVNSVWMVRNEANYYMNTSISALLDSSPRDRVRLVNEGVKNNLLTNFAIKGVKSVELIDYGYRNFGKDCLGGYVAVKRVFKNGQDYAIETETACSMDLYASKVESIGIISSLDSEKKMLEKILNIDQEIALSMQLV
ncbi:hypothetical protein PsalMR5_01053 [Piscirickettsia salmonis]|nr:hypothetical protein PsalSR1_01052 [Piscirickettsia salmonis]QGP63206.1 hypothetical protein PsalMR5_01053 [Piscirickettsia salmonis]